MEKEVKVVTELERKLTKFKRLTSIPYMLILVSFCLPLLTFSCANKVDSTEDANKIASYNAYELASGLKIDDIDNKEFKMYMKSVQTLNPDAAAQFKQLEQPNMVLFGVFAGVLIAAVFAWFSPLGSLIMGFCSMTVMWMFINQVQMIVADIGIKSFVFVDAAYGAYGATMLFAIAFAMNLAAVIRPLVEKFKNKKK